MASLFTQTNIRRVVSSVNSSINQYNREKEKQQAYQHALYQRNVISSRSSIYTSIHKGLGSLTNVSIERLKLSGLKIDTYERKQFDVPKPELEQAKVSLEKEARKQFRSFLFFADKKKCETYVSNHLSERFEELMKDWEYQKCSFEKEEDDKERQFNIAAQAKYDAEKEEINDFLSPTDNRILAKTDSMLAEMELPFDITTSFFFDSEKGLLSFDVEFPDDSIIPTQKATILKSGKLSVTNKTKKELNYDYVMAICGVAYKIAASAFNISAKIDSVGVYGHIVRINDKTATLDDDYLYAVIFDRGTFARVIGSNDFVPHSKFAFFPHKISLTSQYVFKAIDPKKLDASVADVIDDKVSKELGNISFKITSNIPNDPSNPNRAFSPDDGSGFDYLGYHDWKEVDPGDIVLEDSSTFPDWEHMYVYSKSDINKADLAIQQAYLKIRKDFLDGTFYDLSAPGKTNYGFVLFFDLFAAYAAGKSDVKKLCKELDILTIVCGKTERYIKRTFETCFREKGKPQEDRDYVATYFSM